MPPAAVNLMQSPASVSSASGPNKSAGNPVGTRGFADLVADAATAASNGNAPSSGRPHDAGATDAKPADPTASSKPPHDPTAADPGTSVVSTGPAATGPVANSDAAITPPKLPLGTAQPTLPVANPHAGLGHLGAQQVTAQQPDPQAIKSGPATDTASKETDGKSGKNKLSSADTAPSPALTNTAPIEPPAAVAPPAVIIPIQQALPTPSTGGSQITEAPHAGKPAGKGSKLAAADATDQTTTDKGATGGIIGLTVGVPSTMASAAQANATPSSASSRTTGISAREARAADQNQAAANAAGDKSAAAAAAAAGDDASSAQTPTDPKSADGAAKQTSAFAAALADPSADRTSGAAGTSTSTGGDALLSGGVSSTASPGTAPGGAAPSTATAQEPARDGSTPTPAEQISISVARTLRNGGSSVSMRLKPERLGEIEVKMDMGKDGKMTATFVAQHPETLALLRADAPNLIRSLADAGLNTDSSNLQFSLRDGSGETPQDRRGAFTQSHFAAASDGLDPLGDSAALPVRTGGQRSLYDIRA